MKYVINSCMDRILHGNQSRRKSQARNRRLRGENNPHHLPRRGVCENHQSREPRLAEKQRTFIKERSALAPLEETIAAESARIDATMKKKIKGWRLADSIVYATGLLKKAEIVTGDERFKNLQNVFFIR